MSLNTGEPNERPRAHAWSAVEQLVTQTRVVGLRSLTTHNPENRTHEKVRSFSGARRNTRDRPWRADLVSLQT
jgi:hypothetical protein